MSQKMNRRSFMKKSALASASAMIGLSLESSNVLAITKPSNADLLMGKIGQVNISRVIIGSNLFGGGAHSRDLSYVKDTVEAFIRAAECPDAIGKVINVGSEKEISVKHLAGTILDLLGKDIPINSDSQRVRPENSEVERLCAENTKAKQILGWEPAGHIFLQPYFQLSLGNQVVGNMDLCHDDHPWPKFAFFSDGHNQFVTDPSIHMKSKVSHAG